MTFQLSLQSVKHITFIVLTAVADKLLSCPISKMPTLFKHAERLMRRLLVIVADSIAPTVARDGYVT